MKEHINGYALALFSIAKKDKNIDNYKKYSKNLIEILGSNNEYIKIMNSKKINLEEKKNLINKAFSNFLDEKFKFFLFILIERHKFQILFKILKKLIKIINEYKNINEGIIFSSIKLKPEEIKQIEKKVENIIEKKVFLVNKMDQEIISGIRIEVGDEIVEDTILSRLEKLKKELLERQI